MEVYSKRIYGRFAGVGSTIKYRVEGEDEIEEVKLVKQLEFGKIKSVNEISIDSLVGQKLNLCREGDYIKIPTQTPYIIHVLSVENPVLDNSKDKEIFENEIEIEKKSEETYNYKYSNSLTGYTNYLIDNGYKTIGKNLTPSTVIQYASAIAKIINEKEYISFDMLYNNIGKYVCLYDIGGKKEYLGNIGHGTWRNALKRFQEFVEYQEENKYVNKESSYENSYKNNEYNHKTIHQYPKKNNKIMTNAEFLNLNFGTNYKQWMRCSWVYPQNHSILIWMVRFDKSVSEGWQNIIEDENTIIEKYIGDLGNQLENHKSVSESYRLSVDKSQNYKVLGLYKYDRENSDERIYRIWRKVADSIEDFYSNK